MTKDITVLIPKLAEPGLGAAIYDRLKHFEGYGFRIQIEEDDALNALERVIATTPR